MSRAETRRRPDPRGELEIGLAALPSLRLTLKSEPGMSRTSTRSRSTKETRT